jgi:hypothetical protein
MCPHRPSNLGRQSCRATYLWSCVSGVDRRYQEKNEELPTQLCPDRPAICSGDLWSWILGSCQKPLYLLLALIYLFSLKTQKVVFIAICLVNGIWVSVLSSMAIFLYYSVLRVHVSLKYTFHHPLLYIFLNSALEKQWTLYIFVEKIKINTAAIFC